MSETAPLFEAIEADDATRAARLVDEHPDWILATDGGGLTPVLRACLDGKAETARALVPRIPESIFAVAARGDHEGAKEMLEADRALAEAETPDGFTVLHVATLFGQERVVDLLIEYGADIDRASRHESGMLPIHTATISGRMEALDVLLARGADPDAQRADGWTPLMIAAAGGHERVLMTLVHHNCDVDLESKDGKTARDLAIASGHPHLADLMPG